MAEDRRPNTDSSKYKRQIRIAMIAVFIIEFVALLVAFYKLRH